MYGELIRKINKFLNNIEDFDLEDEDGIIFDFTKYYNRLKEYYKNFEFIIESNDKDYVYWLNFIPSKANIELHATPFDISEDLNDSLFSKMERMVFTSATLAVDKGKSWIEKQQRKKS